MRIVAGTARGKRILTLEGREITRPTTEKVREAVFGSLQFEIPDSKVLDLFAGSGAMGIEALSRGAASAVFVDNDRNAVGIIRKNLESTGFTDRAKVIQADYMTVIRGMKESFGYIFLDPPYKSGYYDDCLTAIYENNIIEPDGKIVVEHDGTLKLEDRWPVIKEKRYGKIYITYLYGER
ncbi:MAG: 16S rRNA (guanine(966)-N(2))-methyltransferase RsmD [Clostridia bacterium]|nr:16S rRNA (guanine(966)-N(2))-methyltransferase RsmD [Clostridia bacterium]